jgi:hypothetical protein
MILIYNEYYSMTTTPLPVLRQRLHDAEEALHRLMMGELEVTVSVTGYGATNYNSVNRHALEAYISKLKAQIAKQSGRPTRGPIFFRF